MNGSNLPTLSERLRRYIDGEFDKADAPDIPAAVELKEELITNLSDKCDDLMAQGKSADAAYNIAVAGLGDISVLIEQLTPHSPQDESERRRERRRSALLTSVAVMLYILCVVPVILLGSVNDIGGVVLMFVMIAVATGLIIYNNMTKGRPQRRDTVVEDFKEWKRWSDSRTSAFRAITAALWLLCVAVYLIVSFVTMAWYITWVIFLITAALEGVVKALFDLLN